MESMSGSMWSRFGHLFSWKKKSNKSKVVDIHDEEELEYKYRSNPPAVKTQAVWAEEDPKPRFKVIAIGGSLRKQSRSLGLLNEAVKQTKADKELRLDIDIIPSETIAKLPKFSLDTPKDKELRAVIDKVGGADCILFGCPEYNYSISGPLKDALDSAGIFGDNAWSGKTAAILAVGGQVGDGCRATYHLRQIGIKLSLFFVTTELFARDDDREGGYKIFNKDGVKENLKALRDLADNFYIKK